jgi:ATP-dependent 26S proteasome regulatory subunit
VETIEKQKEEMLHVLTDLLKETANITADRAKREMEKTESEDTKKILAYIVHLSKKVEAIAQLAKEKNDGEAAVEAEKRMSEIVKALNTLDKKIDHIEEGLHVHDDNLYKAGKGLANNDEYIIKKLQRIERLLEFTHRRVGELEIVKRQVNSMYERGRSI